VSTVKLKDAKGVACGCEITSERGREQVTRMCMEHEQEFIVTHAAAIESCSHANRDLVSD
jgi:hypothetical protein